MKHLRLIITIIFIFHQLVATGQVINPGKIVQKSGSEFFVGKDIGKPLLTVNLVSGVRQPGVYHIPFDTQLPQLIAYAGGTTERAELDSITIRRQNLNQKSEVIEVDLEDLLKSHQKLPQMANNDVVMIPQEPTYDRTLTWVSIISGIVSIALSVALIEETNKD